MKMTEAEVKAALKDAIDKFESMDFVDTHPLIEILELFLNLSDEPIEVRRSGARAEEPAALASDLTFQEWMQSLISETDSRPAYMTLLSNVKSAVENVQFFDVLKKNHLLDESSD